MIVRNSLPFEELTDSECFISDVYMYISADNALQVQYVQRSFDLYAINAIARGWQARLNPF